MATESQIRAFINQIAPLAQKAYKTLGKVKPSICIAMACVECGYGTSGSCKHHSYLGQKVGTGKTATTYWGGKYFKSKTGEEYTVGVTTQIIDAFRSYDSMEQCVFNYYELLNTRLYSRVLATSSYSEQMYQIKQCGYMTSSTEVNSVLTIIKKYGLTQYDGDQLVEPILDADPGTYPVIKLGKKNDVNYTKVAQTLLYGHGFYKGAIDGVYGPISYNACIAFQAWKGLVPKDGIIGKDTWRALYR